jgi:hypothetical protein
MVMDIPWNGGRQSGLFLFQRTMRVKRRWAMDFGKLRRFVRTHGAVTVFSSGKERRLGSGDLDTIDLVEKAERFVYEGKSYTKAEFEKLVAASK